MGCVSAAKQSMSHPVGKPSRLCWQRRPATLRNCYQAFRKSRTATINRPHERPPESERGRSGVLEALKT